MGNSSSSKQDLGKKTKAPASFGAPLGAGQAKGSGQAPSVSQLPSAPGRQKHHSPRDKVKKKWFPRRSFPPDQESSENGAEEDAPWGAGPPRDETTSPAMEYHQSPAVAQLASAGTATKHSNPLPEGEAAGVVITTPTQQDALPLKSFQTPDDDLVRGLIAPQKAGVNPAAVYQAPPMTQLKAVASMYARRLPQEGGWPYYQKAEPGAALPPAPTTGRPAPAEQPREQQPAESTGRALGPSAPSAAESAAGRDAEPAAAPLEPVFESAGKVVQHKAPAAAEDAPPPRSSGVRQSPEEVGYQLKHAVQSEASPPKSSDTTQQSPNSRVQGLIGIFDKSVKHKASTLLKPKANQSPAVAQLASAGTATKDSNPLPEGEAAGVVVTTPTQQDALPLKSFQTPDRLNPAAVYQAPPMTQLKAEPGAALPPAPTTGRPAPAKQPQEQQPAEPAPSAVESAAAGRDAEPAAAPLEPVFESAGKVVQHKAPAAAEDAPPPRSSGVRQSPEEVGYQLKHAVQSEASPPKSSDTTQQSPNSRVQGLIGIFDKSVKHKAPTLLKPKGVKHEAPPVLKAIPANQSPAVAQLASAGTATKHSNPLPEGEAAGVVITTPTQQDALPLKSFQTPDGRAWHSSFTSHQIYTTVQPPVHLRMMRSGATHIVSMPSELSAVPVVQPVSTGRAFWYRPSHSALRSTGPAAAAPTKPVFETYGAGLERTASWALLNAPQRAGVNPAAVYQAPPMPQLKAVATSYAQRLPLEGGWPYYEKAAVVVTVPTRASPHLVSMPAKQQPQQEQAESIGQAVEPSVPSAFEGVETRSGKIFVFRPKESAAGPVAEPAAAPLKPVFESASKVVQHKAPVVEEDAPPQRSSGVQESPEELGCQSPAVAQLAPVGTATKHSNPLPEGEAARVAIITPTQQDAPPLKSFQTPDGRIWYSSFVSHQTYVPPARFQSFQTPDGKVWYSSFVSHQTYVPPAPFQSFCTPDGRAWYSSFASHQIYTTAQPPVHLRMMRSGATHIVSMPSELSAVPVVQPVSTGRAFWYRPSHSALRSTGSAAAAPTKPVFETYGAGLERTASWALLNAPQRAGVNPAAVYQAPPMPQLKAVATSYAQRLPLEGGWPYYEKAAVVVTVPTRASPHLVSMPAKQQPQQEQAESIGQAVEPSVPSAFESVETRSGKIFVFRPKESAAGPVAEPAAAPLKPVFESASKVVQHKAPVVEEDAPPLRSSGVQESPEELGCQSPAVAQLAPVGTATKHSNPLPEGEAARVAIITPTQQDAPPLKSFQTPDGRIWYSSFVSHQTYVPPARFQSFQTPDGKVWYSSFVSHQTYVPPAPFQSFCTPDGRAWYSSFASHQIYTTAQPPVHLKMMRSGATHIVSIPSELSAVPVVQPVSTGRAFWYRPSHSALRSTGSAAAAPTKPVFETYGAGLERTASWALLNAPQRAGVNPAAVYQVPPMPQLKAVATSYAQRLPLEGGWPYYEKAAVVVTVPTRASPHLVSVPAKQQPQQEQTESIGQAVEPSVPSAFESVETRSGKIFVFRPKESAAGPVAEPAAAPLKPVFESASKVVQHKAPVAEEDAPPLRSSGVQESPEELGCQSPAVAQMATAGTTKEAPPPPGDGRSNLADGVVPDEGIVAQVALMGFSRNGAQRAAAAVANRSMEEALSWAIAHADEEGFDGPLPQAAARPPPPLPTAAPPAEPQQQRASSPDGDSVGARLFSLFRRDRTPKKADRHKEERGAGGAGRLYRVVFDAARGEWVEEEMGGGGSGSGGGGGGGAVAAVKGAAGVAEPVPQPAAASSLKPMFEEAGKGTQHKAPGAAEDDLPLSSSGMQLPEEVFKSPPAVPQLTAVGTAKEIQHEAPVAVEDVPQLTVAVEDVPPLTSSGMQQSEEEAIQQPPRAVASAESVRKPHENATYAVDQGLENRWLQGIFGPARGTNRRSGEATESKGKPRPAPVGATINQGCPPPHENATYAGTGGLSIASMGIFGPAPGANRRSGEATESKGKLRPAPVGATINQGCPPPQGEAAGVAATIAAQAAPFQSFCTPDGRAWYSSFASHQIYTTAQPPVHLRMMRSGATHIVSMPSELCAVPVVQPVSTGRAFWYRPSHSTLRSTGSAAAAPTKPVFETYGAGLERTASWALLNAPQRTGVNPAAVYQSPPVAQLKSVASKYAQRLPLEGGWPYYEKAAVVALPTREASHPIPVPTKQQQVQEPESMGLVEPAKIVETSPGKSHTFRPNPFMMKSLKPAAAPLRPMFESASKGVQHKAPGVPLRSPGVQVEEAAYQSPAGAQFVAMGTTIKQTDPLPQQTRPVVAADPAELPKSYRTPDGRFWYSSFASHQMYTTVQPPVHPKTMRSGTTHMVSMASELSTVPVLKPSSPFKCVKTPSGEVFWYRVPSNS